MFEYQRQLLSAYQRTVEIHNPAQIELCFVATSKPAGGHSPKDYKSEEQFYQSIPGRI